jgi:hypothetical protein
LYGERYSGRKPAWHELATAIRPEGWASAVAAFKEGKMDYQIETLPLVAKTGRFQLEIPGKFGLFRAPNNDDGSWAYLGIAGKGYRIIQNMEIAQLIDDLGLSSKWVVNTVGAIGDGETIFLTLDAGSTDILGEEIKNFFLVTDTRDAKTAMRFAFTPVDVVCQNTLIAGLQSATKLDRISHIEGVHVEAKDRIALMCGLDKAMNETLTVFNRMAKYRVDNIQIGAAVEAAYPDPVLPSRVIVSQMSEGVNAGMNGLWAPAAIERKVFEYNREVGRINAVREECMERLFRQNDERPKLANTAWGTYQAVVENEDFRDGPISLYASALWGERAAAKVRALKYLDELSK